mmetsp:Transcript_27772/g.69314  ORF Transcript_27772/g.69314 Transcript_27772/m.69314 type:complete len:283 (-) Transcript_27772:2818-3666(-)
MSASVRTGGVRQVACPYTGPSSTAQGRPQTVMRLSLGMSLKPLPANVMSWPPATDPGPLPSDVTPVTASSNVIWKEAARPLPPTYTSTQWVPAGVSPRVHLMEVASADCQSVIAHSLPPMTTFRLSDSGTSWVSSSVRLHESVTRGGWTSFSSKKVLNVWSVPMPLISSVWPFLKPLSMVTLLLSTFGLLPSWSTLGVMPVSMYATWQLHLVSHFDDFAIRSSGHTTVWSRLRLCEPTSSLAQSLIMVTTISSGSVWIVALPASPRGADRRRRESAPEISRS